jgi:dienelactone hydrolase
MNDKDEMNELSQKAYDYIKEAVRQRKDGKGKLIIYGYSWGGVLK